MAFSKYGCGNRPTSPGTWAPAAALKTVRSRGKEKAHMEIEKWRSGDHDPNCGCQPCIAARDIVIRVLGPKAWG